MRLIGNEWHFFIELKKIVDQATNDKGEKLIPNSDLKKREKRFKTKALSDLNNYFFSIGKIIENIEPVDYFFIPKGIVEEFYRISQSVSYIFTKIRSIRAIYKDPKLFISLDHDLQKINDLCSSYINYLFKLWLDREWHAGESPIFEPEVKKEYEYWPQITYDIEIIKNSLYRFDGDKLGALKNFEGGKLLGDIIKKLLKTQKKSDFALSEIYTHPEFIAKLPHITPEIRLELIYYCIKRKILIFTQATSSGNKENKRSTQDQLSRYVESLLIQLQETLLYSNSLGNIEEEQRIPLPNTPQMLSAFIQQCIEMEQNFILDKYHGDVYAANLEFQKHRKTYEMLMEELQQWIGSIVDNLSPYKRVIRKFESGYSYLSSEIHRLFEEFNLYSKSVQDESNRTDLDEKLRDNIEKMEHILGRYQDSTAEFIQKKFPDLNSLNDLISQADRQFTQLRVEMEKEFSQYSDKNLNIASNVAFWEEETRSIANQAKFAVKSAILKMIKVFQTSLDLEEELAKTLLDQQPTDSPETTIFSPDLFFSERMTEAEIRSRIESVETKLLQADRVKQQYVELKEKFQDVLEDHLKKHNKIESQKCIICHKLVNIRQDHYIQCEFCKSLSHYSCAANWIHKYNSCPVCYNYYTVPGNEVFNPEDLEGNEE